MTREELAEYRELFERIVAGTVTPTAAARMGLDLVAECERLSSALDNCRKLVRAYGNELQGRRK